MFGEYNLIHQFSLFNDLSSLHNNQILLIEILKLSKFKNWTAFFRLYLLILYSIDFLTINFCLDFDFLDTDFVDDIDFL